MIRTAIVAATVLCLASNAYAAENTPFLGGWMENPAKSHVTNPGLENQLLLLIIAPYGDDGWTWAQIDVKDPTKPGREEHYSAKFDGKDYKTYGGDPRVKALTRIDNRTLEQVQKRNGKQSDLTRYTVSPDGKTLTYAGNGATGGGQAYTDNVVVFDRVQ